MNMKKLMTTMALAIVATTFAKGLYIVSGGDFRPCKIKYTFETKEANQEVEVTPWSVCCLSVFTNNKQYAYPWFIKMDGVETEFPETYNINNPSSTVDTVHTPGNRGLTNCAPFVAQIANPGRHLVKMYNVGYNVYKISFTKNPYISSIWVDWRDFGEQNNVSANIYVCGYTNFTSSTLPNLKSVYFGNPENRDNVIIDKQQGAGLLNCDSFIFGHPEKFITIGTMAFMASNITNDIVFLNVSNINSQAFQNCPRVSYASFPKARKIESNVFNIGSAITINETNHGLLTVRLGDCLESVGKDVFRRNTNLKTIEFATAQENWIEAWNTHAILPVMFGQATVDPNNPNEATLTSPSSWPSTIYSNNPPLPNKVIHVQAE